MKQFFIAWVLILGLNIHVFAQGYVDQKATFSISESQVGDIGNVQKVTWQVYEYKDHDKNDNKGSWSEFLTYIDSLPGGFKTERRYIVELANRVTGENFKIGQRLLVPSSFADDYRAYSPYPFEYAAANDMPKLFVIDKYTQTFGAYENGKLVRWGLVSSGRDNDLTPPGRYNFNWKDEYRLSSAAPEGEVWELYWMFNFQAKWGIHVHQYAQPIGYAASHGCVRLSEADAKWNFNWANGWVQENGRLKRNGTPVMVINSNPAGRPAHWEIAGGNAVSQVKLPDNVNDVPLGTDQQRAVAWASGW